MKVKQILDLMNKNGGSYIELRGERVTRCISMYSDECPKFGEDDYLQEGMCEDCDYCHGEYIDDPCSYEGDSRLCPIQYADCEVLSILVTKTGNGGKRNPIRAVAVIRAK